MNTIYFDTTATTPVTPRAAAKAMQVMTEAWGNPSSVHGKGIEAEKCLTEARMRLYTALGVKDTRLGTVVFTGSGTEADNLAISGVLYSKNHRRPPRIITTDSEHPAVLQPFKHAEALGFDVKYLSTVGGVISEEELFSLLNEDTLLLSIMTVNNETGARYPVGTLFQKAKNAFPSLITHTDAIQAFGKIPCEPKKLHADLVSVSGHKLGAPKGVGALYCDSALITKKLLSPLILGGGQENALRSGTENLPGIAAFGEAVCEQSAKREESYRYVESLRETLLSLLPSAITVNQPKGDFLPHIVSLQVPGIKSEVLVRYLSAEGIYLSAGSACSSKKLKTSTALTAFGLSPKEADTTVRVSLCPTHTEEDLRTLVAALQTAMGRLARIR